MLILGLVSTGLLTRKLGVMAYGQFVLITSVFLLLDALGDMGMRIIGIREASNEEGQRRRIWWAKVFWVRLLMAILATVLGLVWIWTTKIWMDMRWEATLALAMTLFTSVAASMEMVFQGKMRMDLKTTVDIAFPCLFLVYLMFFPNEIGLAAVFIGYLTARIISLVWGGWLIREIGEKELFGLIRKIDLKGWRQLIKMSWPLGVYLLIFTGYDRAIDSLLIGKLLGPAEVAWYGLAYKIYGNIQQPAYFLVANIFPLLSSKIEQKKKLFLNSLAILSAGSLIVIIFLWFWSDWLIYLIAGQGFQPSILALKILGIAVFFSYMGQLFGFSLVSRGGQKEILVIGLVNLVVNISLNLWLIPKIGIYGAAITTAITEAVSAGLMIWRLRITTLR